MWPPFGGVGAYILGFRCYQRAAVLIRITLSLSGCGVVQVTAGTHPLQLCVIFTDLIIDLSNLSDAVLRLKATSN